MGHPPFHAWSSCSGHLLSIISQEHHSPVWFSVMSVNHSRFDPSATCTCRTLPSASVTAHRRSWTGGPSFSPLPRPRLSKKGEPSVLRMQPTGRLHRTTCSACIIRQLPVPELRLINVSVEDGVGSVRLGQFRFGDRCIQPPAAGPAGELHYPAPAPHRPEIPADPRPLSRAGGTIRRQPAPNSGRWGDEGISCSCSRR